MNRTPLSSITVINQCLVDYKMSRQTHTKCTLNFFMLRVACLNSHNLRHKIICPIRMLLSETEKSVFPVSMLLFELNLLSNIPLFREAYKAELTISPRLHVQLLIPAIIGIE